MRYKANKRLGVHGENQKAVQTTTLPLNAEKLYI
jgi:hypothetical protein